MSGLRGFLRTPHRWRPDGRVILEHDIASVRSRLLSHRAACSLQAPASTSPPSVGSLSRSTHAEMHQHNEQLLAIITPEAIRDHKPPLQAVLPLIMPGGTPGQETPSLPTRDASGATWNGLGRWPPPRPGMRESSVVIVWLIAIVW